ncbi:ATP-grasp domain-containing protein [Ruania suaedae]|uniref:ATP-grasp domain-containing protein n=1 Tax=Ruania suaedae TaxID=2897774 RepID=UPI001E40DF94|nr:ATP-grasp domain-containing protein [Ruania suaedae]UFU02213.1 ATP-grasp domain-containing protein [Ruania suaedae]
MTVGRHDAPTPGHGVESLLPAALALLGEPRPNGYERRHEVLKRELDVVRLEEAALRRGLESIRMDPLVRVFHDGASALGFVKNMSSTLLYLDRATTNRKPLTRRILQRGGVPVARGAETGDPDELARAVESIGCPVVVKPVTGSGGKGVVTDLASVEEAQEAAAEIFAAGKRVLVEEMVHGVDLRVSVVAGTAVASTLRVPASVIGDGSSTIAELAEAKNELRARSDYLRHQPIVLGPDKERFLAARGLSAESVPPAGRPVLLHHVANLSAGGDSYEVLPVLHPEVAALAERAASFFPTSLHAGVDILLERLDAPLAEQHAVVCEVNLNNEMPMHVYPMYGTPVALDELEIAAHWQAEAVIPSASLNAETAPGPVSVTLDELCEDTRICATAPPPQREPAPSATLQSLDDKHLLAALDPLLDKGCGARIPDDGLVHLTGSGERVADRYGRTVLAGEVGRTPGAVHRYARTSGIDVADHHERAETPVDPACVLLMDGTTLLAAQLWVPLTVAGDGVTALGELVEQQLATRRFHAPLARFAAGLEAADLLLTRGLEPATVPEDGALVQVGRSPMLSDGAATLGLSELPWPGLTELAARLVTAIGSHGIVTVAFVPRRRDGNHATWALWRYHCEPPLAPFHSPLHGPGFDPYPAMARRILTGPTRELVT